MIRFFEGVTTERFRHFRIAFPLGNARHGKVHANLRAFAGEVHAEAFQHFGVHAGSDAYDVLCGIRFLFSSDFDKRISGSFADGAEIRRGFTGVDIPANGAAELFHERNLLSNMSCATRQKADCT
ncbi:hypothetical protein SDC9_174674 [bioreactor metagenome]|uniref:Uncharacterized protein n=1 Tax=bioreactor metagenome TaxID=1076179 RepID=A0A645GLZ7_9ZZZZ